jgi:hypothetical protein
MVDQNLDTPKTFISYSWTSPEHEAWVLALATELEESGVHVIIDKWNLREGADKYAFMEKMVTDPTIRKVIVICDRLYAEKADGRKGGVGTETQIISREIYEQVDLIDQEQKFVAVISEKDENGNAYVPTFFKNRIHIDMSDSSLRSENFEQLIRWIFDKPLYRRPERGKPPTYLFTEDNLSLGTSSRFRLAIEALKQDKVSAPGAVRDYFNTFAENLESLRIEFELGQEEVFDDRVVEGIDAFLPYRDEVIDLISSIVRYRSSEEMFEAIHSFFERLMPYGFWTAGRSQWYEVSADNFRFIIQELFLYAVAALLKNGRFTGVNDLVEKGYYFPPGSSDVEAGLVPFTYLQRGVKSFEYRNRRLQLGKADLTASMLLERANRTDLTPEDIKQADFVLFIRGETHPDCQYFSWFPNTLVGAYRRHRPFEVFARAQSIKYFEQLKIALGVANKEELLKLVEEFKSGDRQIPQFSSRTFYLAKLMDTERIASRP